MGKLKSERHHWWPECVSRGWADEGGCVHWLRPDDSVIRTTPNNFGLIKILPRLVTFVASREETDALNVAVHVYAKEAIYYRSDRPAMTAHFAQDKHLIFADHRNPVDQLMHEIPGVPPLDPWLQVPLDRGDR